MRTKQETEKAAALLCAHGNEYKQVQADIVRRRLTEAQVFEAYVANVPASGRDEALFFAARDAAQYVAGKIGIAELVPGLPEGVAEEMERPQGEAEAAVTLTLKEYRNLLRRVERLERRMGLRSEINKATRKDASGAPTDLISQAEACRLLGCGKSTIKRWADKGLVTGYLKGHNVYYSRRSLMGSAVVKDYKLSKIEDK